MRGVQLPDEIAGPCVRVARSLGLVSAGVDLRRTPDGRWFCFEANPTPAFAFYEQYTGQRIADGLIDALLEGGTDYENR
jgi:glutathione synthase/RimK-type ligase-like ATP-grasp enzyme